MKRILQISILLLLSVQFVSAQSLKAYVEAAESAFSDKDYYSSLVYYKEALSLDSENTALLFKVAESARLFNSYAMAEEKYSELMAIDTSDTYPMVGYWLAEMKQRQGKYQEAQVLYNTYMTAYGEDDDYYTTKAEKEMFASEWATGVVENPDENVEVNKMGTEVNTPYSEFSGIVFEDELHYASMQYRKKKDDHTPKRQISKIMYTKDGALGMEMEGLNDDNLLTGSLCYSADGLTIYYTVCDYLNATDIRCELFYRKSVDSIFGEQVKLPDFINMPDFTATMPSIAKDAESDMDILYFVSDREGGKGKLDIWYTKVTADMEFSEPVNVSEINTKEKEITPFFHDASGELYFSSNGYRGLGGFDVYSVSKVNSTFTKPVHLGPPTNSSYNEIFYSLNIDGDVGHMSSNRKGSLYLDPENEGCCYDIYKLDIEPVEIDLEALTHDQRTFEKLTGVTVRLFDAETDELLETVTNELDYDHNFKLKRGRCYYIISDKVSYLPDTLKFCTKQIKKSKKITKKIYLKRDQLQLDAFVFDKRTDEGIEGFKFTLVALDDPNNVVVIENPDGNDFHFSLEPGKKYSLVGVHPYYGRKTLTIDANDADDSGVITRKIYCDKGLNLFLPLVIYFDNDRPGVRSNASTTKKSYTDTYNAYYNKRSEFVTKTQNVDGMKHFFDVDVKGGFEKMKLFLEGLTRALGRGEKLNVLVKGYASPRAEESYNLKLGQRRVTCLRNEIVKFGGGVLERYIKSGQLVVTNVSFGENLAPIGINDQYKNEKLSIFSIEASRERRVEILKVDKLR